MNGMWRHTITSGVGNNLLGDVILHYTASAFTQHNSTCIITLH